MTILRAGPSAHRPSPRILALLLVAALPACGNEPKPPLSEGAAVAVAASSAHEEPVPVVYRASGTVRGRNTAVITSRTTGNVTAVNVRPGDRVTAGERLVELDASDVRASVARARAGLDHSVEAKAEAENAREAARAAAKIAKASYDRASSLVKDNAIPPQEYEEAEARYRSAAAQEQMAEARVRALGSSIEEAKAGLGETEVALGFADIVAPFAGRVLERRVDPGNLASPGTPLLVIADDSAVRVEVPVEESRAATVKIGDEATVEIETLSKPIVGKVGEIAPSIDVASRAFLLKIDLPADVGAVSPGTFARVSFRVGQRPRLVVPASAVTSLGALDRVFVVDDSRARLRMITRGETHGASTEILSGLSPDELVVVAPPATLRDGARVETQR